jgi:hypothetical protein
LSTIEGNHVPVIPLFDVVTNDGTFAPAHVVSDDPKLNIAGIFGFTVTLNEAVVAHCPAPGVNV